MKTLEERFEESLKMGQMDEGIKLDNLKAKIKDSKNRKKIKKEAKKIYEDVFELVDELKDIGLAPSDQAMNIANDFQKLLWSIMRTA